MDRDEAIKRLNSDSVKGIYGYLYGRPFVNTSDGEKRDKIIFIKKSDLGIVPSGLFFCWGYPGPDYHTYYFLDYGITWGFEESDIKEVESYEKPELTDKDLYWTKPKELKPDDFVASIRDKNEYDKIEVGDYFTYKGIKFTVVDKHEPTEEELDDPDVIPKHHIVVVPQKRKFKNTLSKNINPECTGKYADSYFRDKLYGRLRK